MEIFVEDIHMAADDPLLADMAQRRTALTERGTVLKHQEIQSGVHLLLALATVEAGKVVRVLVENDHHIRVFQDIATAATELGRRGRIDNAISGHHLHTAISARRSSHAVVIIPQVPLVLLGVQSANQ